MVSGGTLYRHFPTRESLIDVWIARWEGNVDTAVQRALRTDAPPDKMLENWFDAFATYITIFPGGLTRLLRALRDPDESWMRRWDIILRAQQTVLARLRESDAVAGGVDAEQLTILACAVAAAADDAGLKKPQRRGCFGSSRPD